MSDETQAIIKGYLDEVEVSLNKLPTDTIARIAEVIEDARMNQKQIFIFGNGGSAATATHFACDLSKGGIVREKPRIKAISLCDNVSLMTAWGNDTAYEHIFAEQLDNLVQSGDVAIGISGSGNSPNVLNAVKLAREKGAKTIGFSGFDGGKLKEMVDIPLVTSNYCMEQVEDIHLVLEHVITTVVRGK